MKLTKKQIKEFIADEKKGIKEYKKFHLNKLAKDESKHLKYLKKKLK